VNVCGGVFRTGRGFNLPQITVDGSLGRPITYTTKFNGKTRSKQLRTIIRPRIWAVLDRYLINKMITGKIEGALLLSQAWDWRYTWHFLSVQWLITTTVQTRSFATIGASLWDVLPSPLSVTIHSESLHTSLPLLKTFSFSRGSRTRNGTDQWPLLAASGRYINLEMQYNRRHYCSYRWSLADPELQKRGANLCRNFFNNLF